MSLSGSERGSDHSTTRQSRNRQRKLFRKRDKRSRSSERYEFSDLEDDVFVRGPRKLRRENVEGELSYDYANPGHLKVFTTGLNRTAGMPEFRTVLVSAVATAADVISEALQRCDILYSDGDEFFLCEVIGKLEPYQTNHHHHHHQPEATQFVEQCRRIIGPEEHVLVIQALWKPLYGYYRRFELKQVSPGDSGKAARRQRLHRLRLWPPPPRHVDIDGSENGGDRAIVDRWSDSSDSGAENGGGRVGRKGRLNGHRCQAAATQIEPGDPPSCENKPRCRAFGTQTETIYFASADRRLRKKYPVPLGPYLLLLKGFDSRNDQLVNDLFDVNLLGSDDRRCDVHLRCADVLPEHCVVEACHSEVGEDSGGGDTHPVKPYCMSVAPIGAAEVLLNGQLIDRKHFLSPGDVISIGAGEMCSYVFMFKDASQTPDRSIGLTWLMFLESAQRAIDLQQLLEGGGDGSGRDHQQLVPGAAAAVAAIAGSASFVSTTVPSDSVLETPRGVVEASTASKDSREADAQQLAQSSLGSLLALYFGEAIDLQFAAGLLVLMAVYVTDLDLERASGEIQWHITDSVVTLSKKASQMLDPRDKTQCYAEMIQACALAFEIFLFFHEVCCCSSSGQNGLTAAAVSCQQWRDFCETTMQQMLDNIFHQLGEEVLAQSSALCDTGLDFGKPVSSGGPAQQQQPSMDSFITLLTQVSQAFANAQYQCVSTLRLMIMKRLVFQVAKTFTQRLFTESACLRWNCAVQLRVNLDQLEEWLRQEGLDRFLTAFDLPNSLVDLVATPKSHLVTMSWHVLRTEYPLIPPSLLRCTLAEYESRTGPLSGIWRVSTEDRNEASYNVTCAIEDHFQVAIEDCQIPVEQVKPSVRLRKLLDDPEFNELTRHLDQKTGASNCRLKWHQVAGHIRDRLSSDSAGPSAGPLGGLFGTEKTPDTAVAAEIAVNGDFEGEVEDGALFYDSLSDEGEVGEDASTVRKEQRPKTPSHADPFMGFDAGEDGEEPSSLLSSFTLANTIRNEMHAHRVDSDSDVESSLNARSPSSSSRRAVCPPGFGGPAADSPSVTEALYREHTASFVVATAEEPPPPPPPPRSCSLNGRRTLIDRRPVWEEDSVSLQELREEDLFLVTLTRSPGQSFGMELIDGEKTSLATRGVFIRSVVADTPAGSSHRLGPGDRILAVNGQSLAKLPYTKCIGLIKQSETVLHLLVTRSSSEVAGRVLATAC